MDVEHLGEEDGRRDQHDADAARVPAAYGAVHVVGDRLVLALLEGVPHPERANALVTRVAVVVVPEELLGQDRREVLEPARDGELPSRREGPPREGEQAPQLPLGRPGHGQTPCPYHVVERAVSAAVHRLLCDERVDGGALLRVLDAVAEASHRLDEEALALREEQRQRVPERREVRVVRGTSRAGRRPGRSRSRRVA